MGYYIVKSFAKEIVEDNPPKITSESIAKYTKFANIDDINILETKQKSPNVAIVRL